jgi:hypothetical protein
MEQLNCENTEESHFEISPYLMVGNEVKQKSMQSYWRYFTWLKFIFMQHI